MSDKVREQFEAFMAEGDRSGYSRESLAWVCWLASRAAALEEAAEVAQRNVRRAGTRECSCENVVEDVVNEIRDLAGRGA